MRFELLINLIGIFNDSPFIFPVSWYCSPLTIPQLNTIANRKGIKITVVNEMLNVIWSMNNLLNILKPVSDVPYQGARC
jgi:hypothetical protein